VGVNYFNRKFSAAKKELGLPDTYKFYGFKHTGAGKLLESGASIAELMSHLGHTRFESTIHYIRRHFGERSEKISNFKPDFLDGLKL
jgi:integrase